MMSCPDVWPTRVYLLDFFRSGIQLYVLLSPHLCCISFIEPVHEISNNVYVRPAKPQISLRISAV